MKVPSERQALRQVTERLAKFLEVDIDAVRVYSDDRAFGADAIIEAGDWKFVVEWKSSGSTAMVDSAIRQVCSYAKQIGKGVLPLVAVPFMGRVGEQRCANAEVSWLDLSGNCRILAPRFKIFSSGQPNRYKRRGRPSNVFAPKSARITRWLLMHPAKSFTQRALARATGTGEGHTSRIVSRLEDDGLIVRDYSGAITPHDPDVLLDSWREAYDFSKHHIVRGHIAARSGDTLLTQATGILKKTSTEYAATGLSAAWLLTRFAGFRIVTLYLAQQPTPEQLDRLSFREESSGANVWLVIPNDEGVFQGATSRDGVQCVHPLQAYLDLEAHPERAVEAAQQLRAKHLKWKADG